MSHTVTLQEDTLEIKKSKRLKGTPMLAGDGQIGCHALLLSSLAEGISKLENLPSSPWFHGALENFSRLGYTQPALDGGWLIHGGNPPVSGPEPLSVRHAAELLPLAGFLAATECSRTLSIDAAQVPKDSVELLGKLLNVGEAPPAKEGVEPATAGALESLRTVQIAGGLQLRAADACRPAAAPCRPGELGWDEYQAKQILLAYHLTVSRSLDLSLSKSGPDSLESLAAQFGASIRVQAGEVPEGDELARRIARQMRAAGKQEPQTRLTLGSGAKLAPQNYSLPSDVSETAAFCLAATLIKGSDITLENVLLNPSRAGFLSALRRMGADIEVVSRRERRGDSLGTLRVRSADLLGKRFGADALAGMRDEIFLLMIAAAFAEGETILRDIGYLRGHARDLLRDVSAAFKNTGVEIGEIEDGLVIRGRNDYDGGVYDCLGHPFLGLAYLILGVKSHGTSTLKNAGGLENRFPGLHEKMAALAEDKT